MYIWTGCCGINSASSKKSNPISTFESMICFIVGRLCSFMRWWLVPWQLKTDSSLIVMFRQFRMNIFSNDTDCVSFHVASNKQGNFKMLDIILWCVYCIVQNSSKILKIEWQMEILMEMSYFIEITTISSYSEHFDGLIDVILT